MLWCFVFVVKALVRSCRLSTSIDWHSMKVRVLQSLFGTNRLKEGASFSQHDSGCFEISMSRSAIIKVRLASRPVVDEWMSGWSFNNRRRARRETSGVRSDQRKENVCLRALVQQIVSSSYYFLCSAMQTKKLKTAWWSYRRRTNYVDTSDHLAVDSREYVKALWESRLRMDEVDRNSRGSTNHTPGVKGSHDYPVVDAGECWATCVHTKHFPMPGLGRVTCEFRTHWWSVSWCLVLSAASFWGLIIIASGFEGLLVNTRIPISLQVAHFSRRPLGLRNHYPSRRIVSNASQFNSAVTRQSKGVEEELSDSCTQSNKLRSPGQRHFVDREVRVPGDSKQLSKSTQRQQMWSLLENHTSYAERNILPPGILAAGEGSLMMLIGLVMYISIFKAEIGSKLRPRSQLQPPLFTYRYGFSFVLVVSGFMSTEVAGTCAIFLYIYWHQLEWGRKGRHRRKMSALLDHHGALYPPACRRHPLPPRHCTHPDPNLQRRGPVIAIRTAISVSTMIAFIITISTAVAISTAKGHFGIKRQGSIVKCQGLRFKGQWVILVTGRSDRIRLSALRMIRQGGSASRACRYTLKGLPVVWADVPGSRQGVAERLARSPPTKANRAQSPAGSADFRKWESSRTMALIGGFFQGPHVSPPLHSGAAPYSHESPPLALKTSLLRAAQLSSLTLSTGPGAKNAILEKGLYHSRGKMGNPSAGGEHLAIPRLRLACDIQRDGIAFVLFQPRIGCADSALHIGFYTQHICSIDYVTCYRPVPNGDINHSCKLL
ncbi:hypothetical protein PR048_028342 [Dryococelus australis]|uniref:Uncharacterized protein n=1 Tax=Dryococelus australis TaxID=614101 RepID=A0ABQ9GIZ9_9NEOP|nr:hypothetical protein PR048_028342 [Dryococelus australis]